MLGDEPPRFLTVGILKGAKRYFPGLPAERMSKRAGRSEEAVDVGRHVIGLDDVLGILTLRIAPTGDFHVKFAVICVAARIVPSEQVQRDRWLQLRRITQDETIQAVAETSRETRLRTDPPFVFSGDAQMKRTVGVGPNIGGFVKIDTAAALAGGGANVPVVSTEVNNVMEFGRRVATLDGGDQDYTVTWNGQGLKLGRGVIAGLDEKRGVLRAEVSRIGPFRIRTDGGKGLVNKRLNPPDAAVGVDNNLLAGTRVLDAPLDGGELVWTPW